MAGDPDPAYPPEFEALDVAFARALTRAEGDVALMHKLTRINFSMYQVSTRAYGMAKADVAEREGVE